ncbi:MAG TPA: PD-(D/E)XK nuclease family protein [Alcaligenes sp.]|nr:PD-(D/E)XK nuclease family protein [Alcaligenes sp.]HRL28497.1 PD-(D/E)XK nuclease family protein [Alcaligenes sp.]
MDDIPAISLAQLQDLDSTSTVVLTVNNRYARRLLGSLSARLAQQGGTVAVPEILPLGAWLAQASDQLCFSEQWQPAAHHMDKFASLQRWEHSIEQCEPDGYFLDMAQAARFACEADSLLDEWDIQLDPSETSADYERFLQWRSHYQSGLQQGDLDDANRAAGRVVAAVQAGVLHLRHTHLILHGFHELSPRLQRLLDGLRAMGLSIQRLDQADPQATQVQRVQAQNADTEWRLAIQWARRQLDQNPQARVAIVAAQLETQLPLVHRLLRQAMQTEQGVLPYNVAAARSLAQWPLIEGALAWLKAVFTLTASGKAEPALLGQALRLGACQADQAEAGGRAQIDKAWRDNRMTVVRRNEFEDMLSRYAPHLAQGWATAMATMAGVPSGAQSVDVWASVMRQCLQALGFPGSASLDSAQYQTLEALEQLLLRFAQQAPVLGRISAMRAQSALARMARESLFQPQRDPRARLDVLGFLEAEGGRWDAVWVLGLTDEILPAAVKPNPLIPAHVLRRAQAPRSTPERELEWARWMMAALLRCADQVWLSAPLQAGEQVLRPSPLIASWPLQPLDWLAPSVPAAALETLSDEQGPALQAQERIRGGISVLDTQARSPLWAFVKFRLHGQALPDYARLGDMNTRGLFLHRAVELFWRTVQDQEALHEHMALGTLDSVLHNSVEQAAQEELAEYGEVLRGLEMERGLLVLADYARLEAQRPPFALQATEEELNWSRGLLRLSLRLDRLDSLAGQERMLLDYKTGIGELRPEKDWLRSRPVNLQLPFYAAALQEQGQQVSALAFVRLHARQVAYSGLAAPGTDIEGMIELDTEQQWQAQLSAWKQAVQELADEFVQGRAGNRIWNRNDLQYCDVLPFLRLFQQEAGPDGGSV